MTERPLTPSDRRILKEVQQDGRISNQALAEKVGLAPSPCLRRMKALEADGVITGFRASVDRRALGYGVEALAFVRLVQTEPGWRTRLVERLKAYPEVLSCRALTGEYDLLVRIVAKDIDAYGEFTMQGLLTLPGVADVRSSFVLAEVIPERPLPT